jgi:hypothetical protein
VRKRVFIPAVSLGQEKHIDLLEFSVDEPSLFGSSSYKSLEGCHLEAAIALVEQALIKLPKPKQKCQLFMVNPAPYLSNAKGAALGLLLALYMREKQCPHESLIVTGSLVAAADKQSFIISDSGNLDLTLSAALSLGVQQQPTLYLIPDSVGFKTKLLEDLAKLNIFVRKISSLNDALRFCLTLFPSGLIPFGAIV